jgi:hypothetical protein
MISSSSIFDDSSGLVGRKKRLMAGNGRALSVSYLFPRCASAAVLIDIEKEGEDGD